MNTKLILGVACLAASLLLPLSREQVASKAALSDRQLVAYSGGTVDFLVGVWDLETYKYGSHGYYQERAEMTVRPLFANEALGYIWEWVNPPIDDPAGFGLQVFVETSTPSHFDVRRVRSVDRQWEAFDATYADSELTLLSVYGPYYPSALKYTFYNVTEDYFICTVAYCDTLNVKEDNWIEDTFWFEACRRDRR